MSNIECIHIATSAGGEMTEVLAATLLAHKGIEGDRYALQSGTFSNYPKDHELTFVEAEVAEEFAFAPGETRRNILTRGVRLNDLVGKRFRVGAALCEGTRLCEPCGHLERLTGRPGITQTMKGRGGLRALIVEGGIVRPGDTLTVELKQ